MSLRLDPRWLSRILKGTAFAASCIVAPKAFASVYTGCGILCGIGLASGIGGLTQVTSIVDLILLIINFILSIALLLAVLAIIIAGLYLITSNGDEGQKDKAKKIVFYAIIGIILILFARVIVSLANNIFS